MDELDRMLYQGLSDLSPGPAETGRINPWRPAMGRILWGLALCLVTLDLAGLNYLLPLAGDILLYLGFRSLRRGSGWFSLARGCTVLSFAHGVLNLLLRGTPLRLMEGLSLSLSLAGSLLRWLVIFALWRGLREVFRRAGHPPKTRPAGALVIWYTLLIPLGLLNARGWLIGLPLLAVWALILYSLRSLAHALDEAGYAVEGAPVRLSSGGIAALWGGVACLALAAGVLLSFFYRWPLEVSRATAQPSAAARSISARLVQLGYPEELLAHLTDGELAAMEGALSVQLSQPDGILIPRGGNRPNHWYVQVRLPGDRYACLHHIVWESAEGRYPQYGVEVAPYLHDAGGQVRASVPGGRLLWTEGDAEWEAPLTPQTTVPGIGYRISGARCPVYELQFSLPGEGHHLRAYVMWTVDLSRVEEAFNLNMASTFLYQISPLNYPFHTPSSLIQKGGDPYRRVYRAFQYWPELKFVPEDAS